MHRLLAIALSLLFVGSALAAPPDGVTNIEAEPKDDGTVELNWSAPEGGDIAYYRVYYASESILENAGEYDDFEQTDGPETEFQFTQNIPESGLYIAIMAVNEEGEESEFFLEEVQILPVPDPEVSSPEPTPSQQQSSEPAPAAEADGNLALLSAKSVNTESVLLIFSSPVQVRPKSAATAFEITRSGGGTLPVQTLQADGANVILTTGLQESGVVYQVRLTDSLRDELGVTFDEASRTAFFTGGGEGAVASSQSSAPSSVSSSQQSSVSQQPAQPQSSEPSRPTTLQNITGLRIAAMPRPDGRFDIRGEWDLASVSQNATFLLVGQSFDGGRSFLSPHLVPATATRIDVQAVPAGQFGLLVQTMDSNGMLSSGVFETAVLGQNMPVPPVPDTHPNLPPVGSDNAPELPAQLPSTPVGVGEPTGLPHSGAGFIVFSMMSAGMVAGWHRQRMLHQAKA